MGWFSTPKCPIHGIEYRVDKDEMCQQYYFCPKCRQKINTKRQERSEIEDLKRKVKKLESLIK